MGTDEPKSGDDAARLGQERIGQRCQDCGATVLVCPRCGDHLHFDGAQISRTLGATPYAAGFLLCCPVCAIPSLLRRSTGLLERISRSSVARFFGPETADRLDAAFVDNRLEALREIGLPPDVIEVLSDDAMQELHGIAAARRAVARVVARSGSACLPWPTPPGDGSAASERPR